MGIASPTVKIGTVEASCNLTDVSGYLLWLFPGDRRQFAFIGYKGQYICVDPISKLVMVQTAVEAPNAGDNDEAWTLWSALVDQVG